MGNRTHCSFSVTGKGRFLQNHDANPTIDKSGEHETADATAAVEAIKKPSPEEPT